MAASREPIELTYANARDLARRITAGEHADVFMSPSGEHPRALYAAGLVGPPQAFGSNRIVVAVTRASPANGVDVLAAAGTRLAIEVAGIPLGDYTRTMLVRMNAIAGADFAERAMANVVVEEQLVDAVAARLLAGDADAAVLYATDVAARAPRLRAIDVPPDADVAVTLIACATASAADPERATAWVDGLCSRATQAVLADAGYGPAPVAQSA